MTSETDQILDMIDSIEEAIVHEAPWSNPPPAADAGAPSVEAAIADLEAQLEASEVSELVAPLGEEARGYRAPPSAGRVHPDPPPRSVAWVTRVPGSTEQVLARFKWGER